MSYKKSGFTLVELIGVVILLGLIALIAIPPIMNSVRKTKGEISDASKEILYSATASYLSAHENEYPKTNGNVYCITLSDLVKEEYLATEVYDSVTGEPISLDNKVEVIVGNGSYSYNLNNNCNSSSRSLIATLLNQYKTSNTTGLLRDNTNPNIYYYKGTNAQVNNNHLWYGGFAWRVISIDTNDNTLTLISQQPLTVLQPANKVWTNKTQYESSYINNWLNEYFYNMLAVNIKNNIVNSTFNVGIASNVDEITTNQKVGLLDYDQYIKAGSTNSYLDIKDNFWLGNRNSASEIKNVTYNGTTYNNDVSLADGIRPVIKIKDITITTGSGTMLAPYSIEQKSTNTSDVQVGEYITVPVIGDYCGSDNKCTFRVVSKDSDSIKVVLNGLLPTVSQYGNNSTITKQHTIYTSLDSFFISVNDSYKYSNNKAFNIGAYLSTSNVGQNYEDIKDETINYNVGLPTIGELFSGNDIDLSTTGSKTFVDINTIENPSISDYYWLMNRYSDDLVRRVNNLGRGDGAGPANSHGIRPVIYLKNNLTFTGGNGTAQNPYTLD